MGIRRDYASFCIEVGDMFRSKITGDMFCIVKVDNLRVTIESVHTDKVMTCVVAIKNLIEENIKYDF